MVKVFIPEFEYKKKVLIEVFCHLGENKIAISEKASAFFEKVDDPSKSDWILIPAFTSSLYCDAGKNLFYQSSELAKKLGKQFGVFSNSDLIVDPGVKDVTIFTPGAYASMANQVNLPALLPFDPIEKWMGGIWTPVKEFNLPTLGFCGQATRNPLKAVKDLLKISSLRVGKKFKNSPYLHIPFFLPAYERGKLLNSLEKSPLLNTDFILRNRYKGGAVTSQEKNKVEKDFYENISNNLFTVCLRGFGNYSVRFFQTLAMGRIPLVIETDSGLPFESFLPYGDSVIRIPYQERSSADKIISEYYHSKTREELIEIQKKSREIWEDAFQLNGMLKYLAMEMEEISKKPSIKRN